MSRSSSLDRDTYFSAGYNTAAERMAEADVPTLQAASRALSDEFQRTRYDSEEGKNLMGAMTALADLVTARLNARTADR